MEREVREMAVFQIQSISQSVTGRMLIDWWPFGTTVPLIEARYRFRDSPARPRTEEGSHLGGGEYGCLVYNSICWWPKWRLRLGAFFYLGASLLCQFWQVQCASKFNFSEQRVNDTTNLIRVGCNHWQRSQLVFYKSVSNPSSKHICTLSSSHSSIIIMSQDRSCQQQNSFGQRDVRPEVAMNEWMNGGIHLAGW
jgi:hypothetical protein